MALVADLDLVAHLYRTEMLRRGAEDALRAAQTAKRDRFDQTYASFLKCDRCGRRGSSWIMSGEAEKPGARCTPSDDVGCGGMLVRHGYTRRPR